MILITGGMGFIGSHTALACLEAGKDVAIFDNLTNSNYEIKNKLEKILNKKILFFKGDVLNTKRLIKIFKDYEIDEIIHFAGLKSVSESIDQPLKYYINNVQGSLSLLSAIQICQIKKIVFSSSATVYGEPVYLPFDEAHPTIPMNAYGRTKLQVEHILKDMATADPGMKEMCLRYFNPIGAHHTGHIGENPRNIPNNLVPYIIRVLDGTLPYLNIYGGDYPTKDGTGERDYIHVMDLADGHVMASDYLESNSGYFEVNLGTGIRYSVLDLVSTFQELTGKEIPLRVVARRRGDLSSYFSNPSFAKLLMGWEAKRDLREMCLSVLNFTTQHNND